MFCWQCRSDVAGATPNARMTRIREGRCLARNVGFCWRPHGGFRRPWTRFLGWICQARSRRIVQVGPETFTCMTAASGVGHSYQVQERGTDRLDTPPQAHLVEVLVFCNELRDQRCGRSIPAAKKTDAALRIALSRPSYAFSRCSRCNSADSSEAIRARALVSISLWRTYLRTVSAVPMASRSATACIADRSGACFPRASANIGTARSRNSGGCFFERATTPSFPADENWRHTGAAQDFLIAGFRAGWV